MLDVGNYLFNNNNNKKEKDKMSIKLYQKLYSQNISIHDPSHGSSLIWILVLLTLT